MPPVDSAVSRRCPKCRVGTSLMHCAVLDCGWWICPTCRVQFNRTGNAVARPAADR